MKRVRTQVNIPDDAIYITEHRTIQTRLCICTESEYVDEAMILNEICNLLLKDGQTYYDMTDKSIYYLYQ